MGDNRIPSKTGPLTTPVPVAPPPPPPPPPPAAPTTPPANAPRDTSSTGPLNGQVPTSMTLDQPAPTTAGTPPDSLKAAQDWKDQKTQLDEQLKGAKVEDLPQIYQQMADLQAKGNALPPSAQDMVKGDLDQLNQTAGPLKEVVDQVKAWTDNPADAAADLFNDPSKLTQLTDKLKAVPGLGDQLKTSLVNSITEQLKPENLFNHLVDAIKADPAGAIGKLFSALGKKLGIGDALNGIKDLFCHGKDAIESLLKGDIDGVKQAMGDMGGDLKKVLDGMDKLKNFFNKMMDKVPPALKTLADQFMGPVMSALSLGSSMRDMYNTLRDEGKRTVKNLVNGAMDLLSKISGIAGILPPPAGTIAKTVSTVADKAQTAMDWAGWIPGVNGMLDTKVPLGIDLPELPV